MPITGSRTLRAECPNSEYTASPGRTVTSEMVDESDSVTADCPDDVGETASHQIVHASRVANVYRDSLKEAVRFFLGDLVGGWDEHTPCHVKILSSDQVVISSRIILNKRDKARFVW